MNKNKLYLTGVVQEMAADPKKVPFSNNVDHAKLIEGDDDPMFVTLEVLNPGVSANKRRWTPEMMQSVADQINAKLPDGYMGHIKQEDRMSINPESVTMWVGAKVVEVDGVPRLLAKGYVFPYATKLRTYLKKALTAGKKVAVSVYGEALQLWNRVDKVYDIKEFDLESIDWARSGSEGVKPALLPVIAQEQKEEDMEIKLSEATLEQLKEHRADLVDALNEEFKKGVTLESLKTDFPELYKEVVDAVKAENTPAPAEENAEVKEMRTVLGLGEEADVIQEMKDRDAERTQLLDTYMDTKVAEKIGRASLRPIFKKMVVGEMKGAGTNAIDTAIESVLQSEEGKTLVQEMTKETPIGAPDNNRNQPSARRFTKEG